MKTLLEIIVVNFLAKSKEPSVAPKKTLLEQITEEFLSEDKFPWRTQAKKAGLKHIPNSRGYWSKSGEWPATHTTVKKQFKALARDDPRANKGKEKEPPTKPDTSADITAKVSATEIEKTAYATKEDIETFKKEFTERKDAAKELMKRQKALMVQGGADKIPLTKVDEFFTTYFKPNEAYDLGNGESITGAELRELYETKAAAGQVQSRSSEALTTLGVGLTSEIFAGDEALRQRAEAGESVAEELSRRIITTMRENYPGNGVLGRAWKNASEGQVLSTLRSLEEAGFDLSKIKMTTWDTGAGNKLAGTTGHKTSSDFFVTMEDDSVIGVSLKKDGHIIFANLGATSFIKDITGRLPEGDSAKSLDGIVEREFEDVERKLASNADDINDVGAKVCSDPETADDVFGSNYEKYCAKRESAIKQLQAGTGLGGDERKFVARLVGNSDDPKFKDIHTLYRDIDTNVATAMIGAAENSDEFRREIAGTVVKGLHVAEHLGLVKDPRPPDLLVTSLGTGKHIGRSEVYDIFELSADDQEEVEGMVTKVNDPNLSTKEREAAIDEVNRFFADRISVVPTEKGFVANLNVEASDDSGPVTVGELVVRTKGLGTKPNALVQPVPSLQKRLGGKIGVTSPQGVRDIMDHVIRPLLRSLIIRELDRIKNGN